MGATRQSDLAKMILRYFVRNPAAADTHEGIARWRLLEEAIHQTTKETKGALAWLVSRGFLRETSIAGGAPIFRLNSRMQKEAEDFLRTPSREVKGS